MKHSLIATGLALGGFMAGQGAGAQEVPMPSYLGDGFAEMAMDHNVDVSRPSNFLLFVNPMEMAGQEVGGGGQKFTLASGEISGSGIKQASGELTGNGNRVLRVSGELTGNGYALKDDLAVATFQNEDPLTWDGTVTDAFAIAATSRKTHPEEPLVVVTANYSILFDDANQPVFVGAKPGGEVQFIPICSFVPWVCSELPK